MPNFSSKNIFSELDAETPEYKFQSIKIVDKKGDEFISNFLPQTGGSWNKRQNKTVSEDEINQLIAMLTSDSEDKNNFTANSTQTDVLENRLKNMTQAGGSYKKKSVQKGGASVGSVSSVTSNNLSFLRENANNEISPASFNESQTSSVINTTKNNLSPTSVNSSATSTIVKSSTSSPDSSITSSLIPSNNIVLSETSNKSEILNNSNKGQEKSLFDVASTFIANTSNNISKFFNDSVTPEGTTSSPSNTVKQSQGKQIGGAKKKKMSKKNSKKLSKKMSKKNSKKLSKKMSKKTSKKMSKKNNKKK
jgi:hypothetical protein